MTANSTRARSRARRITNATLLGVAAGAIAVGAFSSAAPANADAGGPYIVIAYSPANGSHGWANRPTFDQAYNDALASCIQFGGGSQCQLGAWGHNECAAVVADVGNDWAKWAGRGGADATGAEVNAVYANGGGQVVLSRCANPSPGNTGQGT